MVTRAYNRKNGRLVETGSFILDIRTKTVGRIRKATGIYPKQRGALELFDDVRMMVKDLDRLRDLTRLSLIKSGKVPLLDALADYKRGRLHFIEANANDSFAKTYREWVEQSTRAAATRRTRYATVQRLHSFGFITDDTPIREIPDVLRRFRARYDAEGKAVGFNQIRGCILSFFRKHLAYDDESPILRQALRVPLIKVTRRRDHHPLSSFRELLHLMKSINATKLGDGRGGPPTDYRPWLLFMTLTGLRPTEFFGGLWQRDAATGHLRVTGRKTANAERVIPHVVWLSPIPRSPHGLHQRFEAITPPTLVRARDLRRTASVWFEAAGIPRSRVSYYMGHGAREMTALYQKKKPTQDELDSDRDLLLAWISDQRQSPALKRKRVWSTSAEKFVAELE